MPAGTPRQGADRDKLIFRNAGRQSERKAESTEAGQCPRLMPRSSRDPKINRQRLENRHSQQFEGSDYSFLSGTCGVTSGVVCPILGILGQEGCWEMVRVQQRSTEMAGIGLCHARRGWGYWVCSACRAKGREHLIAAFSYLGDECYREDRARLLLKEQSKDIKITNCSWGNPAGHESTAEVLKHCSR